MPDHEIFNRQSAGFVIGSAEPTSAVLAVLAQRIVSPGKRTQTGRN